MSILSSIGKALMTPITGTIGAVLGATGLSTLGEYIGTQQQQKFNAKEAEKQRNWQEYMWNQSNAYNDPSAQMIRLQNAGLNANLVYGDGATTLAAQVGSGAHASMQKPNYKENILSTLGAYAQFQNLQAQNENLKVQNENLREDTKAKQLQNDITEYRNNIEKSEDLSDFGFSGSMADLTKYMAVEGVKSIEKNNAILGLKNEQEVENLTLLQMDVEKMNEYRQYFNEEAELNILTLRQTLANMIKSGELIDLQKITESIRPSQIRADIAYSYSGASRNYKLNDLTDAEIDKVTTDIGLAILKGDMDLLTTYSNMYGSDAIGTIAKNLNMTLNGQPVFKWLKERFKDNNVRREILQSTPTRSRKKRH